MEKEEIEKYIQEHKSTYNSKYKFHSFFKKNEYVYKFHYYLRDRQLHETNLFFEITLSDTLKVTFNEAIHEYEQQSLINSALSFILNYGIKSTITTKEIQNGLKKHHFDSVTPDDLLMINAYILYHHGINQKSVDMFYDFYMVHFQELLEKKDFKTIIQEVYVIMNSIMYEQIWPGTFNDYLDQQYYYHLYYIRIIFTQFVAHMNISVLFFRESLEKLLIKFFDYPRFTLCMISILDNSTVSEEWRNTALNIVNGILQNKLDEDKMIPFRYIQALFYKDEEKIHYYMEAIFKWLIADIIHLSNHDMQIALGNYFLKRYGYGILITIFEEDYNAYIFRAFEISEIPENYYPELQKALVNAIYYYKELMIYPDTKVQALDQIVYINRLILENFKDSMYRTENSVVKYKN